MIRILSVFPELLDLNGDAQNALVLAQRARWAGLEAEVVTQHVGDPVGRDEPHAVVVGSGSDSTMHAVLDGLRAIETNLRSWAESGIPLLAVGTGWELLTESVEFSDGSRLQGLGIFPGEFVPSDRVSDDLVVFSDFGRLMGYENRGRRFVAGPEALSLGTIEYSGAAGVRTEGVRVGESIGTQLHGPLLAKNPVLADHVLGAIAGETYRGDNPTAVRVDASARAARNDIAIRLGLTAE
jgi:CobQ-like glutamine amidotransferase family enzyme